MTEPTADVARAYGVLATSFSESLQETRNALTPHQTLLPAGRVDEIDAMLAEFAARRVRVAIYGEVKAGKSTLMNALAGATLSPTAFDPLTSVPIRATYGSAPGWHVDGRSFGTVEELAEAMRGASLDGGEVAVTTDLDLLKLGGQLDLVDTPGVGSEDRFDELSGKVLRTLDAVILVVRYPALFTQYTRKLVEQLQSDISKLFVVWNLDGACAELDDAERERQRTMLRNNVAGAHDLYLVDAKRAFQAARAKADGELVASGLQAFTSALAEYAGSRKREISALREASKRAQSWMDDTVGALQQRQAELETSLAATRQRLRAVERRGEERIEEARAGFSALQAAISQAGEQQKANTRELAGELRKKLKLAARRWVRRADLEELRATVESAAGEYADAVDRAIFATTDALHQAARRFDTVIAAAPRPHTVPNADALTPADRDERSRSGSLPLLRRALWRKWYLPGLQSLESSAIDDDLASQEQWFTGVAGSAEAAGRATLESRLAEIRRERDAEVAQIEAETNYPAESAEFEALNRNVPVLTNVRAQINDIAAEAWYLG